MPNKFLQRGTTLPGLSNTIAAVPNVGRIGFDAATDLLKFNSDGTNIRTVVTTDQTQTLTNKTLTSPVVGGSGYIQVATVDLAGASWNTGNGTALYLSWTAPAAVVIERVIINITTGSTGAATAAVGTTATNNHTTADNLIDDINLQTVQVYSNLNKTDTEVMEVALASAKWVTFKASADPTGTVGKAYIYYFTL